MRPTTTLSSPRTPQTAQPYTTSLSPCPADPTAAAAVAAAGGACFTSLPLPAGSIAICQRHPPSPASLSAPAAPVCGRLPMLRQGGEAGCGGSGRGREGRHPPLQGQGQSERRVRGRGAAGPRHSHRHAIGAGARHAEAGALPHQHRLTVLWLPRRGAGRGARAAGHGAGGVARRAAPMWGCHGAGQPSRRHARL